jgi:hypothetical protein
VADNRETANVKGPLQPEARAFPAIVNPPSAMESEISGLAIVKRQTTNVKESLQPEACAFPAIVNPPSAMESEISGLANRKTANVKREMQVDELTG